MKRNLGCEKCVSLPDGEQYGAGSQVRIRLPGQPVRPPPRCPAGPSGPPSSGAPQVGIQLLFVPHTGPGCPRPLPSDFRPCSRSAALPGEPPWVLQGVAGLERASADADPASSVPSSSLPHSGLAPPAHPCPHTPVEKSRREPRSLEQLRRPRGANTTPEFKVRDKRAGAE